MEIYAVAQGRTVFIREDFGDKKCLVLVACLVFQHAKSCGSFGHEARRLDAREESRPLGKERRTGPGRVDV
jgi:hypothetical protein